MQKVRDKAKAEGLQMPATKWRGAARASGLQQPPPFTTHKEEPTNADDDAMEADWETVGDAKASAAAGVAEAPKAEELKAEEPKAKEPKAVDPAAEKPATA